MISLNTTELTGLIEQYKANFNRRITDETYKWKAVKCFQDNWDIEAQNFAEMLDKALSKTENLLASSGCFPRRMIRKFAEMYPDEVRRLFRILYDESRDLAGRIKDFGRGVDSIRIEWNAKLNHYQNENAISTYLWLRYPDKYYIYKQTIAQELFDRLCDESVQLRGGGADAVVKAFELYDEISENLSSDEILCQMFRDVLDADCYPDPYMKTAAVDFGYFVRNDLNAKKMAGQETSGDVPGASSSTSDARVWLYAPGEKAKKWDECLKNGQMYLGWDYLGDLSQYTSQSEIVEKMNSLNGEGKYTNDSRATWDFVRTVSIGDVVFVKKGRSSILGKGVVTGVYVYDPARSEYKNMRSVHWEKTGEWKASSILPVKTLTDITPYKDLVQECNALVDVGTSSSISGTIEPEIPETGVSKSGSDIWKYGKEDFLQDVYMEEADYDALCLLLRRKKNVILQGAPGVGKTFTARRIAYSMMGVKDDDRVCMVQFHQNFSYEDFVMGYKPDEKSFRLRNGVFFNFCEKARENADIDYFFIIDEINRGNLSRIFGELLMLIEKDYRGPEYGIDLAYDSGKRFEVPNNLYIIGMMNTADRSLAMIDYALRRRFSFFTMKPGFETSGFRKYVESIGNKKFESLINTVQRLNEDIKKELGPGFEIGHSFFCITGADKVSDEWLRSVVNYDLIPMLEEYWFDNEGRVREWSDKLKEAIK